MPTKIKLSRWHSAAVQVKECRVLVLLVLFALAVANFQPVFAQEPKDNGDFELVFFPPDPGSDSRTMDIVNFVSHDEALPEILDVLNANLNLNQDVQIIFAPWSRVVQAVPAAAETLPQAVYDRGGEENIWIAYEYVLEIRNLFPQDNALLQAVIVETVLHEIGHALVDVNSIQLPSGENTEIAADKLAFFILSEFFEADREVQLVANYYRKSSAATSSVPIAALHERSEHLADKERADAYLCWLTGKDEWLDEQSTKCALIYEDLFYEWDDRLEASWKQEFDAENRSRDND